MTFKNNMVRGIAFFAFLALTSSAKGGTRGSDELFWIPTWEQAVAMAEQTGRPIFMMHYTCVGERSPTYAGTATVW
jgi:hypothetical protein